MLVKLRTILRGILLKPYFYTLTKLYKMHISKSARISLGAKLDRTNPEGIYIGDESYVASGAIIFSHDFSRSLIVDTFIGARCFIGANVIVMPGVKIGDSVIIGAGSIVTKDIPSGCIAVGNPAKIIKDNIITGQYGKIISSDKVEG